MHRLEVLVFLVKLFELSSDHWIAHDIVGMNELGRAEVEIVVVNLILTAVGMQGLVPETWIDNTKVVVFLLLARSMRMTVHHGGIGLVFLLVQIGS